MRVLMELSVGWMFLGVALFFGTFGPLGGFYLIFYVLSFVLGGVVIAFYYGRKKSLDILNGPPPNYGHLSPGIIKIVREMKQFKADYKIDKRLTGSSIIDEALQEVLECTFRDYIYVWYKKISDSEEFKYDLRQAAQKVLVSLSERAKTVDWVPYFTTRLVDDFASHLRLFRRAQDRHILYKLDETKPVTDLDCIFFDLESEMEKTLCRDQICVDSEKEIQYLQDISDVLLYLLLPPGDFHNKPFRYICREVLVQGVMIPMVNLLSDPDYINQYIVWLCKDESFTNESFMTAVKISDSIEELQAVRDKIDQDVTRQRAKDSGGHDDAVIKMQLSSLLFVRALCDDRIQRLQHGLDEESDSLGLQFISPGQKLYSLPFDVIMNNNIALAYFIEFLSGTGGVAYLSFYLTCEGYRVTAEQQLQALELQKLREEQTADELDLEPLRAAAMNIFDQYLSEKGSDSSSANPRIRLDEHLIKATYLRIKTGAPSEDVFDEVQARACDILQEEKFYQAFKKSQLYIKLLAELDLLREPGRMVEDGDIGDNGDNDSLSSKSEGSHASMEDIHSSCDSLSSTDTIAANKEEKQELGVLTASITQTGIVKEAGKSYAVYAITVVKKSSDGKEESWDTFRRYSDFHDLHLTLKEKFASLATLTLPGKRTFNNMNQEFLEKRRQALNDYLQTLLSPDVLSRHPGLLEVLTQYLEKGSWEKEKSDMARKMDTIVNPLRNMGNAVKSVPDNVMEGVVKLSGGVKDKAGYMVDGFGKLFNITAAPTVGRNELLDSGKVSAGLDSEDEDNIPLRIMLLMMDEVFELKHKNQWLRRRIVAILRQIIKATFGDRINRKIIDHVEWMTSAEQVAEYVKAFKESFWPGGVLAEPRLPRDHLTKMRTQIACKAKMIGSISDEMRHLIGSETTRKGVLRIFKMFQHRKMNRRLIYVFLEGILETLFPDNKFPEIFQKIHSQSPRVKNQKQSSPQTKQLRRSKFYS